MTLGFSDAAKEEDPTLLTEVLMYIATSTELIRTRQVCRAFRNCSDKVARKQVASLIGNSIRPMVDQSIVGLLRGAEEANDLTRKSLKAFLVRSAASGLVTSPTGRFFTLCACGSFSLLPQSFERGLRHVNFAFSSFVLQFSLGVQASVVTSNLRQ